MPNAPNAVCLKVDMNLTPLILVALLAACGGSDDVQAPDCAATPDAPECRHDTPRPQPIPPGAAQ